MGQYFDFGDIEECKRTITQSWEDFRNVLAEGVLQTSNVAQAKEYTFLKVYDDLFHKNDGIKYNTITIGDMKKYCLGRGAILKKDEKLNYERFIPKKEFIKQDNRFSPHGVEWLYLAIGEEVDIHECAKAECRAKNGDRFGFCHFILDEAYDSNKLIDLTIADEVTYDILNKSLEAYGQLQANKSIRKAKLLGYVSKHNVDMDEFKRILTQWAVYTYSKLLAEQIFVPLSEVDDKSKTYAPFQTMAQYYISLGYSGIIYGSTVSKVGKNLVLFDKAMAYPNGVIEDYRIS